MAMQKTFLLLSTLISMASQVHGFTCDELDAKYGGCTDKMFFKTPACSPSDEENAFHKANCVENTEEVGVLTQKEAQTCKSVEDKYAGCTDEMYKKTPECLPSDEEQAFHKANCEEYKPEEAALTQKGAQGRCAFRCGRNADDSWSELCGTSACADCEQCHFAFADVLASNMVLPRSPRSARIWGFDAVGVVTVTLTSSDGTQVQSIQSTSNGSWQVNFAPLDVNRDLTLTAKDEGTQLEKTLTNVAVGEVYLCAGQSNMEFGLYQDMDGQASIANSANPDIRIADVQKEKRDDPQTKALFKTVEVWRVAGPNAMEDHHHDGTANFYGFMGYEGYPSAVCYNFAKYLYERHILSGSGAVPIGIITAAWGGQKIEQFMRSDALNDHDCGNSDATWLDYSRIENLQNKAPPSSIWNGMINPLKGLNFTGAVWYQGEANSNPADPANRNPAARYQGLGPDSYSCRLPSMITDWRNQFEDQDMAFLYVELAAYDLVIRGRDPDDWTMMREAYKSSLTLPKVGYASAIDLGDRNSPYLQIHPRRKKEVGRRCAREMWNLLHGDASIKVVGPVPSNISRSGNQVSITFRAAHNLHLHGTADCDSCCDSFSPFSWSHDGSTFENLVASAVTINGATVVITHSSLASATHVAYAKANYPECALYNGQGGPEDHTGFVAAPFIFNL